MVYFVDYSLKVEIVRQMDLFHHLMLYKSCILILRLRSFNLSSKFLDFYVLKL